MPNYDLPGVEALREMAADDSGSIFAPKSELDDFRQVFLDRELSWLAFDHRVMLEAAERRLPLYERLRFLAIWASNLDEFYMVRVGGLVDRDQLQPFKADIVSGLTPRERLEAIGRRTSAQLKSAEKLYAQITADMRGAGVEILQADLTDPVDAALCRQQFEVIRPLLTAQVVPAGKPLPFLRNKEQAVIAILSGGKRAELGLVPIARLPKYTAFHVNDTIKILPTAELVLRFAEEFFPDREVEEARLLRVTRNAEINMQDLMAGCEADVRAVMERVLRRRRRLQPVRAQLYPDASKRLQKRVAVGLQLPPERVFVSTFPSDPGFVYAMEGEIPDEMKRTITAPAKNVALQKGDYFSYLARHDLLIALPYQRIDPFVDLLYEAADHPQVESIHITLYRLAGSSRIAAALSYAAQQGKRVVCVLELRARFDEQNNIDYSRMLEAAGCEVIYGLTDYKVHTKLCLIARRLPQGIAYYTQVGTGNYNESTAEQYTDLMLLTTDPAIGRDAAKVFRALSQGE
ncbi:MAG: phospholipase D-like domain-containing protein, partial [Selenomonadaceae bacterium]|nr:phospholipase D-like domain-containing protein [Selenomonadaceae bacterium]